MKVKLIRHFARWHIWLGWLVGVPLLFWTLSGFFMVLQPIDKVRGEHLKAPPAALQGFDPVIPTLNGRPVRKLELVQQIGGPTWLITFADGDMKRADPRNGNIMPQINAIEASEIAKAVFAGDASLKGVKKFGADANPVDLRQGRPAWQATFTDDTHIYIDADTGAVLATRSVLWRTFDFMWGLHIMDLQSREDTSHPVLQIFSGLALLSVLLGLILLFRRRKQKTAPPA